MIIEGIDTDKPIARWVTSAYQYDVYVGFDPDHDHRLRFIWVGPSGVREPDIGLGTFVDVRKGDIRRWLIDYAKKYLRRDEFEPSAQFEPYMALALGEEQKEEKEAERERAEAEKKRQAEAEAANEFQREMKDALKLFNRRRLIQVHTKDGMQAVKASVWDVFAIHRSIVQGKWVLTHIPTGKAIRFDQSKALLALLARRLRAIPLKWDSGDERDLTDRKHMKAVKSVILQFYGM